jgi:hypothetical protein
MFWLFIVSVDRIIAIGSDFDPYGLLVISNSSDAISTSPRLFLLIFYLPLPFYTEYHRTSFLRFCKTSHHLDLTQTAFCCVPRPYPSNSTSTHCVLPSFYCVLLIILRFNSRFIGFTSISLDFCYIHRTAYTDISHHLHSFIRSLLSRISPFYLPFHTSAT